MEKAIQIAYDAQFERKCQYAAEAGFRTIAVNYAPIPEQKESPCDTEGAWDRITENILRILEENNLRCIQSHLPCYDLLQSSEIPDERIDFALRQAIRSGGKIGVKYGVFHLRSSISTAYRPSKSFEDNRRIIECLLEDAVPCDTAIAVENIPIFPDTSKLMPFYSSNFEDLSTLADSFHDDHVVICWDFGHANLLKWDQTAAIEFLGSRIKCTHIHNNFGFYDDHATPDSGNIPWERVMPALAATGFDGPLTLETHCYYSDPELLKSFAKHNYTCLAYLERSMKR